MPLSVPHDVIANAAEAWGLPSTLSVGARTFLPLEISRRRSPSRPAPSDSHSSTQTKEGQREARAFKTVVSRVRILALDLKIKVAQEGRKVTLSKRPMSFPRREATEESKSRARNTS